MHFACVLALWAGRVTGLSAKVRQSPWELAQMWDKQTLASFSVPQLDAFSVILQGECPLLSRAVRCRQRRRPGLARLRRLESSYLDEEAFLAKRQAVAMMRHVWKNYEQHAFGKDELRPVSGNGTDNWGGIGQTLVDALDTLWLMGFMEEFDRAAVWVESSLSFSKDLNVNLFETSIRHLGGLLAAFALSGRAGLLAKARDLGDRLIKAFPGAAPEGESKMSIGALDSEFRKLLNQVGLPTDALDSALGTAEAEAKPAPISSLPSSDINLGTGAGAALRLFCCSLANLEPEV
ncbi:unnamed protein product, partial [Effrenium voratum]